MEYPGTRSSRSYVLPWLMTVTLNTSTVMEFDALDVPHAAPRPHAFAVVVSAIVTERAAAVTGHGDDASVVSAVPRSRTPCTYITAPDEATEVTMPPAR